MNGKIDKNGNFLIDRAGGMKHQSCPYFRPAPPLLEKYCGDWCPLFGEPREVANREYIYEIASTGAVQKLSPFHTEIAICNGENLSFTEFTDERKAGT